MLVRTLYRTGNAIFDKCLILRRSTNVTEACHRKYRSAQDMDRGALIVLEGCDRSGKTTQCKKIVQGLNDSGVKAKMMVFPDRTTPIGHLIDDYLRNNCELEDHAVHLLFTANRWELMPRMKKDLEAGVTLVVDRYSFSGAAFSAAKSKLELDWCFQPEQGLLRPDAVLYFDTSLDVAAKRGDYGNERYEVRAFQEKVADNYHKLRTPEWKIIDASKSIDEVYEDIMSIVKSVISEAKHAPITFLEMLLPSS